MDAGGSRDLVEIVYPGDVVPAALIQASRGVLGAIYMYLPLSIYGMTK